MRIAIVDDSPVDRVQLLECLTNYFAETKTEYETTCYEDAKDFLENYHYTFDFIILDIDMPGLSGINAAKILREKDPNVTLMFVTKMPQYAIEAYSVEAMDYMLKPVSYPDFCLKMKKAERYILRNSDAPILLQTTEGRLTRNASQILYVESRQHYLYYHTKNECLKVRGKLSDASGTLLPYHFARAGESFLVNLSHVKGLDGADVLVDGDRVPVSRRYRTQFLSAFTRYMGGF